MGRRLQLTHQGIAHVFDQEKVVIGRAMLPDDSVSATHATIGRIAGEYLIRTADEATNGVRRAADWLAPGRWWLLASGDVLELGTGEVLVGMPDSAVVGPRLIGLAGLGALQAWALDGTKAGGVTIGRAEDCDVQLTDSLCSRQHARLVERDSSWWLADAGSSGGIYVRGVGVTELRLEHGDEIKIGGTVLVYVHHERAGVAFAETDEQRTAPDDTTPQPELGERETLILQRKP